jgi:hypothetical protein
MLFLAMRDWLTILFFLNGTSWEMGCRILKNSIAVCAWKRDMLPERSSSKLGESNGFRVRGTRSDKAQKESLTWSNIGGFDQEIHAVLQLFGMTILHWSRQAVVTAQTWVLVIETHTHLWLVVWNMNFIFPYIGNNDPNWLSYFSEG